MVVLLLLLLFCFTKKNPFVLAKWTNKIRIVITNVFFTACNEFINVIGIRKKMCLYTAKRKPNVWNCKGYLSIDLWLKRFPLNGLLFAYLRSLIGFLPWVFPFVFLTSLNVFRVFCFVFFIESFFVFRTVRTPPFWQRLNNCFSISQQYLSWGFGGVSVAKTVMICCWWMLMLSMHICMKFNLKKHSAFDAYLRHQIQECVLWDCVYSLVVIYCLIHN